MSGKQKERQEKMKIKADYITNSSSASFIMTIGTDDKTVDEFITRLRKILDSSMYDAPSCYELVRSSSQLIENVFQLSEFTSMYNYVDDIPNYMKTLILEWQLDRISLQQKGIKDINFKIEEDH